MFWWSLQGKTGTLYLKIVRLGYTNSISKTVKIIQFIPTSHFSELSATTKAKTHNELH